MPRRKLAVEQVEPVVLPDSVAGWAEVVAVLEGNQQCVRAELAELEDARRPDTLHGMMGDAAAQARVATLHARDAELRAVGLTIAAALADATQRRGAAVARDRAQAEAAQLARLQDAARDQLPLAAAYDAAARALADAAKAFDAGVSRMVAEGLDATGQRRLTNRTMRLSALYAAGLHGRVPLDPVSPMHRITLERWCEKIIGGLAGIPPSGGVEPPPTGEPDAVLPPAADEPGEISAEEAAAEDALAVRLLREDRDRAA
jgi:hypothetical protein